MIIGINCAVADKSPHDKTKARHDRQAFHHPSGFMPDYSSMKMNRHPRQSSPVQIAVLPSFSTTGRANGLTTPAASVGRAFSSTKNSGII